MSFLSNLEGHFEKTKIKKKDLLLIKLIEKKEGCSWWEKKGFKKVLEPLFQHLSFVNYPRNKGFLFLFIELSQMHFSRTPGLMIVVGLERLEVLDLWSKTRACPRLVSNFYSILWMIIFPIRITIISTISTITIRIYRINGEYFSGPLSSFWF